MRKKLASFLSICIFFIHLSFAQSGIISIFDSETGQSMPFVHVNFETTNKKGIHATISSSKGIVENPVTQPALISVSYLGYKKITDNILPNESKKYYLETDVFLMDQIVVTSTRTEKSLKDAPVITQVITANQIESRGFETVQDILETNLASVEFRRQGFTNVMNIQGIDARNVLILIDGERLAGETNGNVDYSRLNTHDIERIEIIKGAASALYGSQAMGLVINIISKSSKQKIYANVSTRHSSSSEYNFPLLDKTDEYYAFKNNLDRPNINLNATLGFTFKKISSKTTFSLKSTDAYQLFDRIAVTKKFQNPDTIIYENLNETPIGIEGTKDYTLAQNLRYSLNDKLEIEVNGSYYAHNKYDFTRDKKHDFYNDINYGLKVKYKYSTDNSLILSYLSDSYNKYDYLEKLEIKEKTYAYILTNPRLLGTHRINENNLLSTGIEYLHQSLAADIFFPNEINKKESASIQLFIQDDLKLSPRSSIIAGLRGEYHSTYGSHFTPKISFMHKWVPFTIRLNYAAGHRSPSLKELYYNWDLLGLFTLKGDKNLQPETNNYFSISSEFSNSRFNFSLSFYKNYFKNKIIGRWENNQTIYQFANAEKSELSGIDFLLKIKLFKPLIFKSALSYVNDKNRSESVRLSSVSPYTANAQLEYKFTKGIYKLVVNISGQYIGAKDFNVLDEIEHRGETIEAYYTSHFNAYSIWKLSLSQRFYNAISMVIGVNNLFDYTADLFTFNTSITSGRQYFVKFGMSIDKFYNKIIKK